MKLLAIILFSILSLLSVASARNPPYCTPTGAGVCNLGWEFDWDINKFHIWVYDRNCNELGNKDYVGWFVEKIPTKLPHDLLVANKRDGPDFSYNKVTYHRENCAYMQGPQNWLYAGQCAFACEAPGDGTGGGGDNVDPADGGDGINSKVEVADLPLNETLIEGN